MRVLLVSDSHGRNQNMEKVIRKASPVDLLIHLGDLEGSTFGTASAWMGKISVLIDNREEGKRVSDINCRR